MGTAVSKNDELQKIWQQSISAATSSVASQEVQRLKDISVYPNIDERKRQDYYVESVNIEYYVAKESRFTKEVKYLFLQLIDPVPANDNQKIIFNYFKQKDQPIDIIHALDMFPQFMKTTFVAYGARMQILESLSRIYRKGLSGEFHEIKKTLYLNEALRKWEPTLPSLEIFGDFTLFNINWGVRFLNIKKIPHELEDDTVAYLIDLNMQKMKREKIIDKRFLFLSQIYREQAFPHTPPDESENLTPVFVKNRW